MSGWSWHFISDVHVKNPGDKNEQLLLTFLEKSILDKDCEKVFLCGDIYDLMVGNFDNYRSKFSQSFKAMKKVLEAGKDLYFIEGNHDFNIKELITSEFNCQKIDAGKFYFSDDYFFLLKENQKFLICHGDTIEIDSGSYPIYKKLITSRFIKLFIDNVVSFNFLEGIGNAASKRSRERGVKAYGQHYNEEVIKEKFRKSVLRLSDAIDFDVLVCGHSHVKDDVLLKEHIRYLNNGYAPISKTFIRITESGATFQSLN